MKRIAFVLAAGVYVLHLAGCGAPRVTGGVTESFAQYCPAASSPVVVLPFANETVDMDAPGVVRQAFIEGIQKHGVNMVPVETTDEKLRENGITQGGQLGGVEPQTLKEVLGADYVFYGNVQGFSSKNALVYVSRWVKAGFKLVHTPSGEAIWDAGGEAKEREYHMDFTDDDAMKKAMVRGLVSGLAQSALKDEAEKVVARALSTLPAFEGNLALAAASESGPAVPAAVAVPVGAGVGLMPPDFDAAFRRLVSGSGIEFDEGFLASRLRLPGQAQAGNMTVKLYLSALQYGIEQGDTKVQSLGNWRKTGNEYRVEMRGPGGRADIVLGYDPNEGLTGLSAVDPATGASVRGFLEADSPGK